jgi:ATP-dependent Clp protease ATP-binding subunit ClpC
LEYSAKLLEVIQQARQLSDEQETELSSAHFLIAFAETDNPASFLIDDQGISPEQLAGAFSEKRGISEPEGVIERLYQRAERLAAGMEADEVSCFHFLSALIRDRSSQSFQLLEQLGINTSALRTSAMGMTTGQGTHHRERVTRSRVRNRQEASKGGDDSTTSSSTLGIHPSLGDSNGNYDSRTSVEVQTEPENDRLDTDTTSKRPTKRDAEAESQKENDSYDIEDQFSEGDIEEQQDDTAESLAARLFDGEDEQIEEESDPREENLDDPSDREPRGLEERHQEPVSEELAEKYRLDESEFPTLTEYGTNLTYRAATGQLDEVFGRDEEINQLIDILGKRRTNNPLLIGEPGVGKTAIVEGLARQFVERAARDEPVGERAIVEINLGQFTSETHLRGALAERLVALQSEVKGAEGNVIVFLDEIHNWIEFGQGSDSPGPAEELKTALARGEFPCIGATTTSEYTSAIDGDGAIERRFETVLVEEPDPDETLEIIEQIIDSYAEHHGVDYTDSAMEDAVFLSERYLYESRLPDKAISLLDLAGSRVKRKKSDSVKGDDIKRVISDVGDVPYERLARDRGERFVNMESYLRDYFVGHDHVVERVSDIIRRNYAGFQGDRPIGTMLFLGPTGVGKTELVKVLAEFLFHDRDAIVRIDMSEFREAHSVSRMVGSPPGYVGHGEGGELTEQIRRRPYQIVLFDEIEKAHSDVLNLLLQLMDEGSLSDGKGRKVDFSQTVVVLTSNLGSDVLEDEVFNETVDRIGFASEDKPAFQQSSIPEGTKDKVKDSAKNYLTPELWNRLDEKFVFEPLRRSEIKQIAELQLEKSKEKLRRDSKIELRFGDDLIDYLIDNGGYDPQYGARPMRQTIERNVEVEVAKQILEGTVSEGDSVTVDANRGEIVCRIEAD